MYTNFHLDRERRFLELSHRFVGEKYRHKVVILSFLGYLGEFESDSQNGLDLHVHCYGTASASNFQVLTCSGLTSFDSRKLYPLFGLPSSYSVEVGLRTGIPPNDYGVPGIVHTSGCSCNVIMREMAPIGEMTPIGEMAPIGGMAHIGEMAPIGEMVPGYIWKLHSKTSAVWIVFFFPLKAHLCKAWV